jgi:large subunit ribosomal protein L23
MKAPHEVIKAPLISEKGTALTESANQVLFKVRPNANKIEVKQAVEQMFKVKVEQVRMARYLGKVRRIGRSLGRLHWKKLCAQGRRQNRFFWRRKTTNKGLEVRPWRLRLTGQRPRACAFAPAIPSKK